MHRCAASCYDNESYSVHRVANCVENCGSSLNKAQQYITEEIERVQVLIFAKNYYYSFEITSKPVLAKDFLLGLIKTN